MCGSSNPDPARFCNAYGERLSAPEATPRRRIVAALFCDLVGSTELAERTDPEVLKRIMDRYFTTMRASIERHGGTVEKFIGDAVVGAFGIPNSHEDDALRAVRAALEMREAADDLDREVGIDARIQVRIGIDAARRSPTMAPRSRAGSPATCSTPRRDSSRTLTSATCSSPAPPSVSGGATYEPSGCRRSR